MVCSERYPCRPPADENVTDGISVQMATLCGDEDEGQVFASCNLRSSELRADALCQV